MNELIDKLIDRSRFILNHLINMWRLVLGFTLIPFALKSLLLSVTFPGAFLYCLIKDHQNIIDGLSHESVLMLLSLLLMMSSLSLVIVTISLLMKKKWSRYLLYIILPIQYFLLLIIIALVENDWVHSLLWNSLIPPFYLFLIWFLNRPSINEEFGLQKTI